MFYAHFKISEDTIIKANLENLEITGVCPICGTEYTIEMDEIEELPDGRYGSAPFCDVCSAELHRLSPIPDGKASCEYAWFDLLTKSNYPSHMFSWSLRNAPKEFLHAASDWMMAQVPGYHNDLPLGDINDELARRQKEE